MRAGRRRDGRRDRARAGRPGRRHPRRRTGPGPAHGHEAGPPPAVRRRRRRDNRSVLDAGGAVLAVSQFTLYGDTSRGRRPSWSAAALASQAGPLVEAVVAGLRGEGLPVATGRFGAEMDVELVNDGPVTVIVEV